MEKLNPTFEVLFQIKKALLCGKSIHLAVSSLSDPVLNKNFGISLSRWLNLEEKDQLNLEKSLSPSRQILLDLIRRGLRGEPILKALSGFEAELKRIAKAELESYSANLQIKLLLPVLFLMLPAYLILLFGPILKDFSQSFQ